MNRNLLFATIVSALGSLLFGFDTAVISGTTKFLTTAFNLTPTTLGYTVSIALLGTTIGAVFVGKPGDILGRKGMLYICGVLYLLSALGCAFASSWAILLVARFLGGIAIGAASVMAPMYIAEIAPAHLRGRLVAVAQFNIVAGILLAFFSNVVILQWLGEANPLAWRWMFGVMAIPSVAFIFLLMLVPESPRWLVKKSFVARARSVLTSVGAKNVEGELADIIESLKTEAGSGITKLFQKKYNFAIICAVLLAVFNQLSGINVIMYYAPMIFEKAGASTSASMWQAVAVGATNMVFTIIAMFFIDKLGRKTLLLIGAIGMGLSLAGAGAHDLFGIGTSSMVVFFVIGFIAFFAFSQGAVIWVFLAEIFPNTVRSKGSSLGSSTHWIMNTIIGFLFPVVLAALHNKVGPIFMFFAVMQVPFFIFVWRMMPETKGKSLEELEKIIVRG